MSMKKRKLSVILMLIILAVIIYFLFFYAKKCSNKECFDKALEKCKKAEYLNEEEDASWLYKIKAKGKFLADTEIREKKKDTK